MIADVGDVGQLEDIARSYDGVDTVYAMKAGREVRVIVESDKVTDSEVIRLSRELSKRFEAEVEYSRQIKVHVIREIRAVNYAM